MGSTTVTVLFTDLVGSTALFTRLGPRGDVVRRSHFAALRAAVAAHGGEEVKNLGDGLMVSFASAGSALACAVSMQHAITRLGGRDPQEIRIGVSAGDVTADDGDLFGPPVVEAARLCAVARGGQILVADVALSLARPRTFDAASLGPLLLKGFDQPLPVSEVRWLPVVAGPMPLPPDLGVETQPFFVGREPDRRRLTELWEAAAAGSRQAVFVAGEPGVGKTRLAVELARAAHAQGAVVLYGRCDEELGDAYQPFAQALRHFVSHCWLEDLAAHVEQHGPDLSRLVPEIGRRIPNLPAPEAVEPELHRVRLFEAVASVLVSASREAPVLLVLDDLHWAARPTLLMLRHLLRDTSPAALLVIAIFRDTELPDTHPLVETLGELRGRNLVEQLTLTGLDEEAVTAFVEATAGRRLEPEAVALARAVHAQTDGNPFFVGEVLRHLRDTGAINQREGTWSLGLSVEEISLPAGVRYTVGGRLTHLSAPARQTLAVAAVVGREFGLDLLERVGTVGGDELVEVVEEVVRSRLVHEVSGAPGRCAFTHALVRQTLYEQLTTVRRARLHRRVGEALEEIHGADVDAVLPALAHHFCAAAGDGQTAKAAGYALRAALRALDQAAHEDAAEYLQRGLAALELNRPGDIEQRCDLLLALARTRAQALDHPALRETSLRAAELARALGSGERLARAAYWYNARAIAGTVNPVGIALCEEALAAFDEDVPALRALVMATLARERAFGGEGIAAEPLSREALALAEGTGDPDIVAVALIARYYALWGSERVTEQLEIADRLGTSSAVTPSGLLASTDAHRLRAAPLFVLGDVEGFRAEMNEVARLGDQLHSRYYQGLALQWQAALAFLQGRFADAERLAAEALAIGGDDENFKNSWAGQLFHLHSETGRLAGIKPMLAATIEHNPGLHPFRAALAFAHASLGELDDARRQFDVLALDDFAGVSRNILWPNSLALMSEVCTVLDDADRARLLLDLFRPYSGLLVVFAGGSHCTGAVDRYLGMLATVLGRFPDAEAHFQAAVALEERVGSPALLARSRYWYGRMLISTGDPTDQSRGAELLATSLTAATALGMAGLATQRGLL